MIWALQDPDRAQAERDALDALCGRARWLVPGDWRLDEYLRLVWDAGIVVGDRKFNVTLIYPNHFPHSPPMVVPKDKTEHRWSSHQYGAGGELCLEWRPDNWHPDVTGAMMIESAQRLLSGERPAPGQTGEVRSAHRTTLGQNLRGDRIRLVVTRALAECAQRLPPGAVRPATAITNWRGHMLLNAVRSIVMSPEETWNDPTFPAALVDEGLPQAAILVRAPAGSALAPFATRSAVEDYVTNLGGELADARRCIILTDDGFQAYYLDKDEDRIWTMSIVPPQPLATRVDADHAALAEKSIAIIGCGSVGSKIAIMLARSGVGNFLLLDDDIMMPDNLVRHDLDWREIGAHKADAVARRIQLVNPAAKADYRTSRLGGQQAGGTIETLLEKVAACDLIVDATASAHAFNYACAAVASGKKPLVWCKVYGGGYGGMIARYRPGIEPQPPHMREIIEQWCHEKGRPMPRAAAGYENGGDGPPMIADDADVSVIAAHAARLAIDTVLARTPSMFPYSVYMIGLAQGWIFDQPFETHPVPVGTAETVSEHQPDEAKVQAEIERLGELFAKRKNEIAAPQTGSGSA